MRLSIRIHRLAGRRVLIEHNVGAVLLEPSVIVDAQNLQASLLQVPAVSRPKAIAIDHDPLSLDSLLLQPATQAWNHFRRSKGDAPTRALPRFAQRQTSHHMARPNLRARVC